jgi:exopolysaccharide biosynthesis polyprenyl glycosylphosphotransferase
MLRTRFIDIVILADCTASMKEIDGLATLCEKELVKFKVIPSYFQILTTGLALQTISGIPILGISQLPLQRPANQIVKRTVDIVGSIAGLILSAPLIAIFGAIVYLESPGPIFYRQTRLGRGGVPFEIIKIRSMRLDAEKAGKPGWTVKDDPRRLRIGAFIRSWNIDELPQFWNVLQGDMSLVGPRPERPELIASFKEEIIHYQARHSGKPGLTGWAAINGLRGDTDLTERIRCDIYYLENWSLWLDFQIMFLTFFRRKNAG